MYGLMYDSSVKEIEAAARNDGYPSYWYLTDDDFRYMVLDTMNGIEEAFSLADKLDAQCEGYCQKAMILRNGLNLEFWSFGVNFRRIVAMSRRTCCKHHETGSFAVIER